MRLLLKAIDNAEYLIAGLLLVAVVVMLTVNVFARYVLGTTIAVTEELVRLTFIWTVMLASSVAVQKGAHVRVTVVADFLPRVARGPVRLFSDLVWVGFNVVVIVQGASLVSSMFEYPYRSAALGWSMAWIYIAIPVGLTLGTLRLFQGYVRARLSRSGAQEGLERAEAMGLD